MQLWCLEEGGYFWGGFAVVAGLLGDLAVAGRIVLGRLGAASAVEESGCVGRFSLAGHGPGSIHGWAQSLADKYFCTYVLTSYIFVMV